MAQKAEGASNGIVTDGLTQTGGYLDDQHGHRPKRTTIIILVWLVRQQVLHDLDDSLSLVRRPARMRPISNAQHYRFSLPRLIALQHIIYGLPTQTQAFGDLLNGLTLIQPQERLGPTHFAPHRTGLGHSLQFIALLGM
jgi:hypothetical protein